MFHLYFGAFDVVLYTGAIYTAMALSKAICDDLEQGKTTQETTISPATQTTLPTRAVAPDAQKDEGQQRVSVGL